MLTRKLDKMRQVYCLVPLEATGNHSEDGRLSMASLCSGGPAQWESAETVLGWAWGLF